MHEYPDSYGPPTGALLPLGGPVGHRGYGLALLFDILAGVLLGAGSSRPNPRSTGDGLFLMAIDVRQFSPLEDLRASVAGLLEHMKSSLPAPGLQEVMVPGEYEFRQEQKPRHEGIVVEETTWAEIQTIARELGVGTST